MRITQYRDFPASPVRSVSPHGSFADFAQTIAGGGSYVIKHASDSVAVTVPGSDSWLTGSRPIFSWFIKSATVGHPGLSLKVETSYYEGGAHLFNVYTLYADSVLNVMEGLFVPGWAVRLTLLNASGNIAVVVAGIVKQQGF